MSPKKVRVSLTLREQDIANISILRTRIPGKILSTSLVIEQAIMARARELGLAPPLAQLQAEADAKAQAVPPVEPSIDYGEGMTEEEMEGLSRAQGLSD